MTKFQAIKLYLIFSNLVINNHVVNVETEDPNVFAFITHLVPPNFGTYTVGKAWRGTLCYPNNQNVNFNGVLHNAKGFRTSINSWTSNGGDLGLARVRRSFRNEY